MCPSSWRLAALGPPSTEFTVGGKSSLAVHGVHVLGECYSLFGGEISALAAVFHTCEVGLALGHTSGGGGITVCTRNVDCLFSAQHPLCF